MSAKIVFIALLLISLFSAAESTKLKKSKTTQQCFLIRNNAYPNLFLGKADDKLVLTEDQQKWCNLPARPSYYIYHPLSNTYLYATDVSEGGFASFVAVENLNGDAGVWEFKTQQTDITRPRYTIINSKLDASYYLTATSELSVTFRTHGGAGYTRQEWILSPI